MVLVLSSMPQLSLLELHEPLCYSMTQKQSSAVSGLHTHPPVPVPRAIHRQPLLSCTMLMDIFVS